MGPKPAILLQKSKLIHAGGSGPRRFSGHDVHQHSDPIPLLVLIHHPTPSPSDSTSGIAKGLQGVHKLVMLVLNYALVTAHTSRKCVL